GPGQLVEVAGAGRGLGGGGGNDGADDPEAPAVGQVAEHVVVGDQHPPVGGDAGDLGAHGPVDPAQLLDVGGGPGGERAPVDPRHLVGDGAGQGFDDLDHPEGVGGDVGVDVVVVAVVERVPVVALVGAGGERVDVVDGLEDRHARVVGGLDGVGEAGLEPAPGGDDEVGLGEGDGLAGRGLERVGVGA